MNTRTHAAFNLITGEVLTTNHGRHLKRRVAQVERWNLQHGYGAGKWVFAHGNDWREKTRRKIQVKRGNSSLLFAELDLLGLTLTIDI